MNALAIVAFLVGVALAAVVFYLNRHPVVDIKNPLLRRAVAVVMLVPIILVAIGSGTYEAARDAIRDTPDAFRVAWRGRE